MKKIFTISLLCFSTFISAQNLQFSRVIDTIISINIPIGTIYSTVDVISSTSLTPPNNTTWKIQSISMFLPSGEEYKTMYCGIGSVYSNDINSIYIKLFTNNSGQMISSYQRAIANYSQHEVVNSFNFPVWVTNNTVFKIGWTSQHNSSSPLCLVAQQGGNINLGDYIGSIHFSILEFNTQ